MRIEFTKMQGLGNDFVIFDAPKTAGASLDSVKLRALADRHLGVGFDQALMLEAPRTPGARVFGCHFKEAGQHAWLRDEDIRAGLDRLAVSP